MNLQIIDLTKVNIVFAFEELNRDYIFRDQIRKALPERPIITDLPDVLFVRWQEQYLNAVIDNKRIVINKDINDIRNIEEKLMLLSSVSRNVFESSHDAGRIIAYGFNFIGKGQVDNSIVPIGNYFKETFFKSQSSLEECLQGEIYLVSPKFALRNSECEYHIELNPLEQQNSFSFNYNFHFPVGEIPSSEELYKSLNEKHDLIRNILEII